MARPGPSVGEVRLTPSLPNGRPLLTGEQVLSHQAGILLTNYRVQAAVDGSSAAYHTSFTLDSVASCGMISTSQPVLLVLGILMLPCALFAWLSHPNNDGVAAALGFGVAAFVFFVMYLFTRRTDFAIVATNGQRIMASVSGNQREAALVLLDSVEHAKLRALGRITP